jgi:hypothetical protein
MQAGFRLWHETDIPTALRDVRSQGKAENISSQRVFRLLDPERTLGLSSLLDGLT